MRKRLAHFGAMTTAPHDSYVERLTAALAGAGFAPPVAEALAGFDQENYQFIRRVRKGDIPKALIEGLGAEVEPMQFHALAAVTRIASGFGRDGPGEVTVGHLAEDLMVDASRASRLASDLVDRGFLRRAVSQQDGRRSVLEATEAGQALIERFLAAKWERTIRLFRDWPEEDILTFARLFRRYGEGMREQYPSG